MSSLKDEKYINVLMLVFSKEISLELNKSLKFDDIGLCTVGMFQYGSHAISILDKKFDINESERNLIEIQISEEPRLFIKKTFRNESEYSRELNGLQTLKNMPFRVPKVHFYDDEMLIIVKEMIPGTLLRTYVKTNPRNKYFWLLLIRLFYSHFIFIRQNITLRDLTDHNLIVEQKTRSVYLIDLESFRQYPGKINFTCIKRNIVSILVFFRRSRKLISISGTQVVKN